MNTAVYTSHLLATASLVESILKVTWTNGLVGEDKNVSWILNSQSDNLEDREGNGMIILRWNLGKQIVRMVAHRI
jgi:hypothetical protein